MKKFLITVLAALMMTGATAQEAFPDIPAGHWAGEAVTRIADLGIVIGFPDGTFRGNESFTRYQMALVISRLLDVIQANMNSMKAMTDADIAALRNALQELASDVAAQGVRLNAVEGAVASIADNVASNTARIEALENMEFPSGIDEDVIADLLNQIAAVRLAADTASAQAAAAADAAAGAADAAAAAQAQANRNASAINAINDLLALLNSDIEGLKGDVASIRAAMDGLTFDFEIPADLLDQVNRNSNDIANIREFVILLRRDQVALRDRVSALEASDAAQDEAIAALQARVQRLEDDFLSISGSIELMYRAYRLSGAETPFDSDRAWGLNAQRDIGASRFSSGDKDLNDDGDKTDVGEKSQDRADITSRDGGDFSVTLTLNVGFSASRGAVGSPRALNSFDTVLEAELKQAYNLAGKSDGTDLFDGYVFNFKNIKSTLSPIGAEPLTFEFGKSPKASFTPYVFDSGGPGFVATVGSPDFLAFLSPTLTIAYGAGAGDTYLPKDTGNVANDYYRGIRGTLSPLQGDALRATGGFSLAQYTINAGENSDAAGDNETVTVWGVDGQIGISIIDLAFEFANQSGTVNIPAGQTEDGAAQTRGGDETLLYVTASVDVASLGIPVLKTLIGNYRAIPASWFGVLTGTSGQPFNYNQTGFGVKADLALFILDPLTVYFDSFENAGVQNTAFGADAKFNIFRAFSITGFFHQASQDGVNVAEVTERRSPTLVARDNAFGVRLVHDGASADALIPNLNLSVEYKQNGADLEVTNIEVKADYLLSIAFIELSPYAEFLSVSGSTNDRTRIRAGTGIETDPLGIFLAPSLNAAVNFRTTNYTAFTASELQFGVGLTLNEFLFANSTLEVRYGSWTGTNVATEKNTLGSGDNATDISGGDVDGSGTQSVSGYEVHWNYYDLQITYGAYDHNNAGATGAAQAFRISYKVEF